MVPLSEQNPALWRRSLIDEADAFLKRAWRGGSPGIRTIQATIHGTWCWRKSLDEPAPWAQVLALYDLLLTHRDDAIMRLNRAAAMAEAAEPHLAMCEIDSLDAQSLVNFLPYHALRVNVLQRVGRVEESRLAYDAALGLGPGPAERIWLERRKRALDGL